jgi:hypothetical protein
MFQESSSDDGSKCHHRSNIVHLDNDEETEDEEDVKVAPVARSLFLANDGKNKKQRYSPLEPSLFAPIDVDDGNDEDDYCYDDDDDVEVVDEVGSKEDGGFKEDGGIKGDGDGPVEKENMSAEVSEVWKKKPVKKEPETNTKKRVEKKNTVPLSINKKKENVAPSTTKKKRKTDPDDAFSVEVIKCFNLTNEKKEATERFRLRELHRHNKAMEDLASREQTLKERQSDFDFKIKRLEHYRELKEKFDPEFIKVVFPEMAAFIDADALIQGVIADDNIAGGKRTNGASTSNIVANGNMDSDSDGN